MLHIYFFIFFTAETDFYSGHVQQYFCWIILFIAFYPVCLICFETPAEPLTANSRLTLTVNDIETVDGAAVR